MTSVRRCAVIGDVHAEDERLEVALRAAVDLRVDTIACTGDIVDGRGSVERCCRLLREYNVCCVRGNHDRWVFTGLLRDSAGATRLHDLAPADQQFLQELPATRDLVFEGGTMMLCHGVGRFDLEKLLSYDTEYSVRTNRYLREVTDSGKYRLMVNGHSHERLVLRAGAFVVVNAGSLAHPEDPGFVLLDFPENLVRWYSVADSGVALVEEQPIFCE